MTKPKPRCGERESWCVCARPEGHRGFHECLADNCGGRWRYNADGVFEMGRMPGGLDFWSELEKRFAWGDR